jgi:hypothetical protein
VKHVSLLDTGHLAVNRTQNREREPKILGSNPIIFILVLNEPIRLSFVCPLNAELYDSVSETNCTTKGISITGIRLLKAIMSRFQEKTTPGSLAVGLRLVINITSQLPTAPIFFGSFDSDDLETR